MDEQLDKKDAPLKISKFSRAFDATEYEVDERFQGEAVTKDNVHTLPDLIKLAESNKDIEIDAIVMGVSKSKKDWEFKRLKKDQVIESIKKGSTAFSDKRIRLSKIKESVDSFGQDFGSFPSVTGLGDDFIPLMGGPFYKQLYYYDYIRAHQLSFYAANHDPLARAIINITRDFTLGRGFRVDSTNKRALAIWRAFEKVNDLQGLMRNAAVEIATYGETMVWKLPEKWTKITQQPSPDQPVPTGYIPRIRLIDPSTIWEIVTYPEDITNVLYYVWVAPTQYQIYSNLGDKSVPTTKFIFQTVPANQVRHYRVNVVSNEKRGRSDLFPILGDLKRLRDSVNFQIAALQKQSAWAIDIEVDGSQTDIDGITDQLESMGQTATAGSEWVHSPKIKRTYLSAQGTQSSSNQTFEWVLSRIAAGCGIPVSYFGTHLSGGQTRASAHVGTEPVTKKFEARQLVYEKMIQDMWDDVMEYFGIDDVECEVTFPELLAQDRTAKLKDLALSQVEGWISKKRAAEIAAKELGVTEYEYDAEQEDIAGDAPAGAQMDPLSAPGENPQAPKMPTIPVAPSFPDPEAGSSRAGSASNGQSGNSKPERAKADKNDGS